MATYKTKQYVDSNWVSPAADQLLQLSLNMPNVGKAFVDGDVIRFTKLRPDVDGLGSCNLVGAAAVGGPSVRYLELATIAAGSALLKQISPYRTITGLTDKNEGSFLVATANGTAEPTPKEAWFDKNDVCLATGAAGATPPAGTVKIVRWPSVPFLGINATTAASAAGTIILADANKLPVFGVTVARKMNTKVDGNNIQRYYEYNTSGDGTDLRGTAGKT